ncbi:AraC family transcriptional regulator [Opitutaceae bacterium TAV5]|nr:AraC family transcriptional regulator [Opitutaceae bacterium TAV5]
MAVLVKNIPKPMLSSANDSSRLADACRRLPAPESYFDGVRRTRADLPDNILLFQRDAGHRRTMSGIGSRARVRDIHHRHILITSLRGEGRVIVNGRAHVVRPGRCVLVLPYQFHHYSRLPAEGFLWMFVTFDIDRLPKALTEGAVRKVPEGFERELLALADVFLAARGERSAVRGDDAGDVLSWRLALLLSLLASGGKKVRAESLRRSAGAEQLLMRVHAIVSANFDRHLTTEEIAGKAGVSESHLRSLFRKAAGMGLGRFQRTLRLQHAAMLLTRGGLTVAGTAEACGWDTPFSFSRAFRKFWGRPPKKFGR